MVVGNIESLRLTYHFFTGSRVSVEEVKILFSNVRI